MKQLEQLIATKTAQHDPEQSKTTYYNQNRFEQAQTTEPKRIHTPLDNTGNHLKRPNNNQKSTTHILTT